MVHKHISIKKGELLVWNIPMLMFPLFSIIDLYQSLNKKYGKSICDILYKVGEKQTLLATDYSQKRFGFRDKKKLIEYLFSQSTFLGFGELKILKLNLKTGEAIIKQSTNPFAKYYLQLFGKSSFPIDDQHRGNIAGIIKGATGQDIVCIETKCIAQGDQFCLYFTKKPQDINPQFKDKIPKEKIKERIGKHKDMIASPK